jgi:hypothetical protein
MRSVLDSRAGLAAVLTAVIACDGAFDSTRKVPGRGSLGVEVYGVLCDRIGGQALREDLTGESFYGLCHQTDGAYEDKVDEALLPKLDASAKNLKGETVSMADQASNRARAIGRVEAFAKRRKDLIAALDFAMPDDDVDVKDTSNPDAKASCDPSKLGFNPFYDELSAMLGRFTGLYNDGTIPYSTRSLAKVLKTFQDDSEAQKAYARMATRKGYRPPALALGIARPAGTYPQLRDLSNSLLGVISNDSKPYDLDAARDGDGNRIPVPGAAYEAFSKFLEVSNLELRNGKASGALTALSLTADTVADRTVLSRPRDNLEIIESLVLAQDPAFGAVGSPTYIVKRDARGYAQVVLQNGAIPAPFVDANGDKLADIAADGGFVTKDGTLAPTPFVDIDTPQPSVVRDSLGRPQLGTSLAYEYVDTSKTFMASTLADVKNLAKPDAKPGEGTLLDLGAGLPIAIGARDGSAKTERKYADGGAVTYNGIQASASPMLDMLYALTQLMGERAFDETLVLTKQLFLTRQAELARVVGAIMAARNASLAHPEAKIPLASTLWDDVLEVVGEIANDKTLVDGKTMLEDLIEGLSNDDVVGVGAAFGSFATYKDKISYDRNNLNGPSFNQTTNRVGPANTPVDRAQPDTGDNRSIMQRFLQLVADTNGVTACNRAGAVVHAKLSFLTPTLPLVGTYKECEVYKIEDLGKFYLQTIVGEGRFYMRDSMLRNGVAGLGAATTGLIEESSGITGFWTSGRDMRPRPEWANRFVHFDTVGDSPNPNDKNYRTNYFLNGLEAPYKGTNLCSERLIDDPCNGNESSCFPNPADNDIRADKKVHLRDCKKEDQLNVRHKDSLFTLENFGFYRSMAPVVRPFVMHKREDLFGKLTEALSNHWQTDKGTAAECKLPYTGAPCFKSGTSSYEPALKDILSADLFPAINAVAKAAKAISVPRCTAVNPAGVCTASVQVPGLTVLAEIARAAASTEGAKLRAQKDRKGATIAARNDGKTHPQTTPLLMLANAFGDVDRGYAKWDSDFPMDTGRKEVFVRGRSALADVYLRTEGSGASTSFGNKGVPRIVPIAVDSLRAQMWARCPKSFVPPYEVCAWARTALTKSAEETLTSPLTATAIDLVDGIRRDPNAKRELERLLKYMGDPGSPNDAFAATLTSGLDVLQILRDETNLIPFLKVAASATSASVKNEGGRVIEKSMVDAQLALLGKISGKAYDREGTQICKSELDPNQILPQVISKLVSPMTTPGLEGRTPVEVLIDVIADVNRAAPSEPKPKLDEADYSSIGGNVVEFLLSRESGLEQFYEIVRKGTIREKE